MQFETTPVCGIRRRGSVESVVQQESSERSHSVGDVGVSVGRITTSTEERSTS